MALGRTTQWRQFDQVTGQFAYGLEVRGMLARYAQQRGNLFLQEVLERFADKTTTGFTDWPSLLPAIPTRSSHYASILRAMGGEPLSAAERFEAYLRQQLPLSFLGKVS